MPRKRIVILGGGISGIGASVLAKKQGFDVFVSDFGEINDANKIILNNNTIKFEEKQHSSELILNADEIIKSPGIPDTVHIIISAKEKNIPVISEIEFAARYTNAKLICITGSNGKTTTTELIYHIFKNANMNVALAGNVGKSFAMQVAEEENFDYYIIELSSFQLDGMHNFKADIAILLNITPDHLDRYKYDFQNYTDSKFRIAQNMTSDDAFIYCEDDEIILKEIKKRNIKAQMFPFSVKKKIKPGAYKTTENIFIDINTRNFKMENGLLSLEGDHNMYNSMAAGITTLLSGISNEDLKNSLSDFAGVEHRLEKYIKVRGIQFVNDSKATNVNSVWYALQTIVAPIVLIMGGVDKGNDYGILKDLVRRKVKAIVAMGIDNKPILEAFEDVLPVYDTDSINLAVKTAYQLADEDDTVLLSPACASFDLFKNYEARGKQFKNAIRDL
ncbi:MAG: UDP-N-acetylmuramoyl-L-alanine--D-glutamate ligase [Bacteroidales bacterium]|nr:UDP-N-acetylmuramoyl-L-alanine--D-glutamate ligase [Bacteroidales bacterium]